MDLFRHVLKRRLLSGTPDINCLFITGGTIALFVPGLGWGALAIGAMGSIGTTIGSKNCEKSKKRETDAIIEAVSQKSGNCISVAKMANCKKEQFETEHARLVNFGLTEEHANIIIILGMIEESFQTSSRLAVQNQESNDLGDNAWICTVSLAFVADSQITTGAASVVSENHGKITEWLLKSVAPVLTAEVIKKTCVGFAAVAVTVNIYQLVKTCMKDSEAVVLIEEICEMIEEGEDSLQFFIDLLRCLKEGINQQINVRDRNRSNLLIASLTEQMANYSTTIEALQSQITAQTATIEELRHTRDDLGTQIRNELRTQIRDEFETLIQHQNQAIYLGFYSLQNGIPLPPPEEIAHNSLPVYNRVMNQAPRNSIDFFENE